MTRYGTVLNWCAFTLEKICCAKRFIRYHVGAREVTRKHKCEMEAANMQLVLSFSCIPASSADRLDLQQIPSSGRRTAVRFKRLQARRRNGRLVLICDWILENRSKSHIRSFEINGFKDLKPLQLAKGSKHEYEIYTEDASIYHHLDNLKNFWLLSKFPAK